MAETTPPPPAQPASTDRPFIVHFTIGVVAVLFLLMVGVLYYHWLTKPEPNAMLVVRAGEEYTGATIELVNSDLSTRESAKLTTDNDQSCRFFLSGGRGSNAYSLRIIHADGRTELMPLKQVEPYQRLQLFIGRKPTTNPSTPTPTR